MTENSEAQHDEVRRALRVTAPGLIAAAVFSGAINILYLSSPLYLMQIYNRVITSGSMPTLAMLTLALTIALATMALLDAIRARVLVRGAMRLDRLLGARLVEAMVAGPPGSEGGAQALRDFDQFRSVLAGPSIHFLFDMPWTPLYLLILFLVHPWLGLVASLGTLLLLGFAVLNETLTRPHVERAGKAATRNYDFTDGMVRRAEVIRAMGMRRAITRHWRHDRDVMLSQQAAAGDRNAGLTATIRFLRLMLQAAMLAVGAWLTVDHAILPATIFAASVVMGRALVPVEQAVTAWRQFGAAGAAALRIRRLLHRRPPEPGHTRHGVPEGGLVFDRVSVVASTGNRTILKGVSLELHAGETLGVIGVSGAGKSTLARLMVGVIAPSAGHVRLGGIDLAQWPREQLGRHLGYLPEEAGLFAGSVRDNIARFADENDDDAVTAAARLAGVHEMILSLPDGYDTELSDSGRELSGGQRQRIGLARALYGMPRLLVLDEPNAHLDGPGERALEQAVSAMKAAGRTVVVVTHRPSTIGMADRLLVLRNGSVELAGTSGEVMESLRLRAAKPLATIVEP